MTDSAVETEIDWERIRRALDREELRTSLRELARTLDVSPTGLRGFLDGADPYVKTGEKYRRWYLEHGDDRPDMLLEAAFREVLRRVRPDRREAVAAYLQEVTAV
jgi:hypothetical protein